jgi:branched-chain amino acid transport system permease protein
MRPGVGLKLRRDAITLAVVFAVYLAVSWQVTNSYYQLMLTLVPIWAVLGLSWNLLSGYAGLTSFGHAAFFGIGAYTVTLALVKFDITPWIGIPLGMVVGAGAAFLIGLPTFRLRGHYFALAMLAYPLAILYVLQYLGFQEVSIPMKRENPAAFLQFADPRIYTVIAVFLAALAAAVSMAVENSRFGLALLAIKQNELAAEAAGINARRWKMQALVLSGALAAAGGGLYACVLLVVTPEAVFGVLVSAQALVVTLFGGVATLWGPLIGAVVLIPLAETLNAELGNVIPGIQGVVYGGAIIGIMLIAPEGLFWTIQDRWFRPAAPPVLAARPPISGTRVVPAGGHTGPILEVRGLSRAFGGLRAVDDVSFTVNHGEILGIIGPNGAGKTTLFNVLNGVLSADAGEAVFEGKRITGRKLFEICRMGVGRTFQVVRSFPRLPVLDNVVIGAYGAGFADQEAIAAAQDALARTGMSHLAQTPAGRLTNKELRLMELARALAAHPRILLLDETLAGLGREECDALLDVLQHLRENGMTVVIIEHTMHAMMRIADRFLVLDHGAVLAIGAPREVVENRDVIEAYLGKKWLNRVAHV